MVQIQSKESLERFTLDYLNKFMEGMDAETFEEIMEGQLAKMSFEEKKKLMMMILDSCVTETAQVAMLRDTIFN